MIIIVYSETDASTIGRNLGVSEYSYYFVLKKYLPILESIGEVVPVRQPELEVDAIYDRAVSDGQSAVFMSFSPPHRTALDLRCPTICVLAWEFSSIPDETWGEDPRDNWVETLSKIGNVITISDYSTEVVRGQIDAAANVATIPAPVTDLAPPGSLEEFSPLSPANTRSSLSLHADVIDTRDLDISDDIVCFKRSSGIGKDLPAWDGPVSYTHLTLPTIQL